MRVELAPFGIRVIEILPGPIDTEMFRSSGPSELAFASDVYGQLATFAAGLKEGVVPMAQPPATAAAAIADIVLADEAPLRNGCDPVSDAMLDSWRSTTDEDLISGMNEAYAAFREEHDFAVVTARIVVVTGGATGIGAAIARRFITDGDHVIVADVNDDSAHELIMGLGVSASFLHTDMSSDLDVQRLIEHVLAHHGQLDVMCNNAGVLGSTAGTGRCGHD